MVEEAPISNLMKPTLLVCVLVLFGAGCTRYQHLRAVIHTHLGFAHLTPGVNGDTVAALRKRVTAADVPLLLRMLHDRDHLTQIAAAEVLAQIDPEGVQALKALYAKLRDDPHSDFTVYDLVRQALRNQPSP
jgi:hypothetical protein